MCVSSTPPYPQIHPTLHGTLHFLSGHRHLSWTWGNFLVWGCGGWKVPWRTCHTSGTMNSVGRLFQVSAIWWSYMFLIGRNHQLWMGLSPCCNVGVHPHIPYPPICIHTLLLRPPALSGIDTDEYPAQFLGPVLGCISQFIDVL